ncbi:outer membrane beta-barrel protein, partial [Bacteroidota bacterium]
YYIEDNKPDEMAIYDINIRKIRDLSIGIHFSPALTNIHNKIVAKDNRFISKRNIQLNYGLDISYFFKSWLGVGSGFGISTYQNSLELNHFDPVDGFNSNITDVKMNNTLQYIDVPLMIKIRTANSDKTCFYLNTGTIFSFLAGSSLYSSGWNINNLKRENVLSDNFWKQNLKKYLFTGFISAGINLPVRKDIIVNFGVNYIHGLTSLENYSVDSYSEDKYKGDFNPLFAEPDSRTFNRAIGLEFGINYIF